MLRYLTLRIALAVPTLLITMTIIFVLLRIVPGDPAAAMLGDLATAENVARLRHQLGIDRPLYAQYASYFGQLLTGDLGRSIRSNDLVTAGISNRLPLTILLAAESAALSVLIGVPAGVASATRPHGLFDASARLLAIVGISMPAFWFGIILLYVFSVRLNLFPVLSVGEMGGWLAVLHHSILPACTLAAVNAAIVVRMTRASLLEVYHQDYIRTARAKGVAERVVRYRHALRNAWMPVVTIVGYSMGRLLGGVVVVETVFSWPGMGKAVIDAMRTRDYPVVQGAILVFAVLFILVNVLVDVVYAYLDPRIRYA